MSLRVKHINTLKGEIKTSSRVNKKTLQWWPRDSSKERLIRDSLFIIIFKNNTTTTWTGKFTSNV